MLIFLVAFWFNQGRFILDGMSAIWNANDSILELLISIITVSGVSL